MKHFKIFLIIGTAFSFSACNMQSDKLDNWSRVIYMGQTSSSPRAVDLNRDGIPDIVMGAGGDEFAATDDAVLALNGVNGDILWKVAGRNQMVGSAIFKDVTGDGIPDVFIGWDFIRQSSNLQSFLKLLSDDLETFLIHSYRETHLFKGDENYAERLRFLIKASKAIVFSFAFTSVSDSDVRKNFVSFQKEILPYLVKAAI